MEDMIEEVLVRLPIESLMRCKILSKKWHHYITCNPSFCQSYLSRHYAGASSVMLGFFFSIQHVHQGIKDQVRFLPTSIEGRMCKKRKRVEEEEEVGVRLPSPLDESLSFLGHQSTHVAGSSNGFLLSTLELEKPVHYFICNPVTKQWRALPIPKTISENVVHGFVCHPTMSGRYGYQVVRCMWEYFKTFSTNLTIEVFTSELNEWKLLNLSAPFSFFLDQTTISAALTEQGVIYMSAVLKKPTDGTSITCIVFFDQTKPEQGLQLMELPQRRNVGYICSYLGQSNGLVLYAYYELRVRQLKVWVLNPREWSLKYQVSLEISAEKCPEFVKQDDDQYFEIEAFHPFNPQLIFLNIGRKRVLFDVDKSSLELVCDFRAQGWGRHYFLFPFTCGLIGNSVFVDS